MTSLVQRLKQRKLVQWSIAYLASAWAILEAAAYVAERFGWPEIVLRALTLLAFVGFFVALVLAWYHGEQGRQRVSGPELLIIALLFMLAGGVISTLAPRSPVVASGDLPAETEAPGDAEVLARLPGLAVLPFANRSSAEEDRYFAEGIYDDLLTRLQRLEGLRVISRTSADTYRDTPKTIPTIGRELGVEYVLEGGVQRAGDRVRINVQLIDARSEGHLWADMYDRELTGDQILEVQSEIVRRVAQQLGIALVEAEEQRAARRSTRDPEAWALYARGWDAIGNRDLPGAEALWQEAAERDPTFLGALCVVSRAAAELYSGGLRSPERARRAHDAAERALAVDPDSPDAQLAMAVYLYRVARDWEGAMEWLGRAGRTLRGDYLYQFYRGLTEEKMGRWVQSVASIEAAIAISPRYNNVKRAQVGTLMRMRRYDEAEGLLVELLAEEPEDSRNHQARDQLAWMRRGDTAPWVATVERFTLPFHRWELEMILDDPAAALAALEEAPDSWVGGSRWYPKLLLAALAQERVAAAAAADAAYGEAARTLEPLAAATPDDERYHEALALTYAGLDRREDAIREAREAVAIVPLEADAIAGQGYLFSLAAVLARFGEIEEAVAILERLLTIPSRYSAPVLRRHYLLRPLWTEPSFVDLLEREPGRVF